jgi:ribosome-associated protein
MAASVQTLDFRLTGDYVELCNLLKLSGVAASGGQGKALVAAGEVRVDGRPESRKTAKIRAGQRVACGGVEILVKADT